MGSWHRHCLDHAIDVLDMPIINTIYVCVHLDPHIGDKYLIEHLPTPSQPTLNKTHNGGACPAHIMMTISDVISDVISARDVEIIFLVILYISSTADVRCLYMATWHLTRLSHRYLPGAHGSVLYLCESDPTVKFDLVKYVAM